MKTLLLTSILFFISSGVYSQISLTQSDNALILGDSFSYQEIQFTDPGNAGPNQIWDFSRIQFTGKSLSSSMQSAPAQKIAAIGEFNLSLSENGYNYFMNSSQNKLEECGYVNNDLKMTLVYSDPVVKMKYPFSYGENFIDHFIGVANVNETNRIDFFGDNFVAADAYGTLILPGQVIENALRVKSTKKGLQINMCGTTDVNIIKYSWYASGYRYPVLNVSTVETRSNDGAPVITKSAYTNTGQRLEERSAIIGLNIPVRPLNQGSQIEKPDVSVTVSPNPFLEILTFQYFLSEQLPVSIELYDSSGKHSGWLAKDQIQPVGLHTDELNAMKYNLTPGVYFIRFTFDKQVVISRIVKI
jgi:hypothetical protein